MKFEYQGKEIKPDGAVRRYLKSVERNLCLPKGLKKRVLSDLLTTICARQEQGETAEAVLASLGTPRQTAEEFNEQLKEYTYRRSPWRFAFLLLAVLSALWLAGWGLGQAFIWSLTRQNASVGIIGGADGPTQILVATSTGAFREGVAALILLVIGIVGFVLLRRMKKK
ncbi:MAG: sodium ion-translocating decarboxylase subunit beta [Ruminococcaceae bacterium]|nr:sodium ion-translocating decarboxylase subunit beta [Oscillospiraceae bacterium]